MELSLGNCMEMRKGAPHATVLVVRPWTQKQLCKCWRRHKTSFIQCINIQRLRSPSDLSYFPEEQNYCPGLRQNVSRKKLKVVFTRQKGHRAVAELLTLYDSHLKQTRNLAEVVALYDEQTRKFAAFSTAADAVVEKLREENDFLVRQLQETGVQESINRFLI